VRLLLERRKDGVGVMAQLQLGEQAKFYPSDAALAGWMAQADEGRAQVV
jgi:DNA polymerase-3 subunit alpha